MTFTKTMLLAALVAQVPLSYAHPTITHPHNSNTGSSSLSRNFGPRANITTASQSSAVQPDFPVVEGIPLRLSRAVAPEIGSLNKRDITQGIMSLNSPRWLYQHHIDINIDGQALSVMIDTGSPQFWVQDSHMVSGCDDEIDGELYGREGIKFYPERAPSFSWTPTANFELYYSENNQARGQFGVADVQFGGQMVKGQTLGLATGGHYCMGKSSGILGLGMNAMTTEGVPVAQPPQQMWENHLIKSPVFSLALTAHGGNISFGGPPAGVETHGKWAKVEVPGEYANASWWGLQVDALYWEKGNNTKPQPFEVVVDPSGSGDQLYTVSQPFNAILDSGAPTEEVHPRIAKAVAAAFEPPGEDAGNGVFTVSCDARPPDYGITLGGTTFWYRRENMILQLEGGTCTSVLVSAKQDPRTTEEKYTYGLGTPFLQNVVAVFNLKEKSIDVAQRW